MTDLDFIHTKNQLEILILKIENKYSNGNISKEAENSLKVLYTCLNLILKQESLLESLKKEIISIKLHNLDAYKETARLKNEVKKLYK